MRLYVMIRHLPRPMRPCALERYQGSTLVAIHRTAMRADVVAWCITNLNREEQNTYRAAHDQPPVGQPIDDGLLEGLIVGYVPPCLRLPEAHARQDGVA